MKGDTTLKTATLLSILLLLLLQADTHAISKDYSGKPIPTKGIVDGIQYVKKGDSYIESEEVSFVIVVDEDENTLKITCPSCGDPDSLYFELTLGDLISVRFEADVTWDKEQNIYSYNYTVKSENASKTPIDHIRIDQLLEYKEVKSASGWIGGFNREFKTQSWSQFEESDLLMPGTSVSGFGYVSENPPVLGNFFVSGEINQKTTAEDDLFFPVLEELLDKHEGITGITIIPGPKPERIHGRPWIMQIINGFNKLTTHGYAGDNSIDVHRLLIKLYQDLGELKKPTFDDWSQLIDDTLSDLAAYESEMEPEAWSYITENLKYMQRNKDIVWFGK